MGTGIGWLDTLLVWGGAVTLLAGLGGIAWRSARGLARLTGRVDQFMDDWYGEPERPGVPARPGILERVGGIETRLEGVEHELHPNDGGSLRDAIDQANRRLQRLCPDHPQPDCAPPDDGGPT